MKKQTGFTLIELMVILAVVSIVAGFGVPQISSMIQSNRIATQAIHLSAQLQFARSEAIRRAEEVKVISNDADDPTNWLKGWTVYFDTNNDNAVNVGEELRIVDALDIANFTIIGPADNIVFSGEGSSGTAHTLTLTDTNTSKSSTIEISMVGSVKIK